MLFLSPSQFCFSLTENKTNEICFLFFFLHMYLQLNFSTAVTLGTEESGRYK